MKTIDRLMKIQYYPDSPNSLSSISFVGSKFKTPKQCVICNDRDTELVNARVTIKDLKKVGDLDLSLPYCKKHRIPIIFDFYVPFVLFPAYMLWAVYVIFFNIVQPETLEISTWIEVGVWGATFGVFGAILLKGVHALKKYLTDRMYDKAGICGVKAFKDLEYRERPDPFVRVRFAFHNDLFAEALTGLNPSISDEFVKEETPISDEGVVADKL